ncbi:MAG: ABC transporter permease [Paracoccaceae bacterium]
MIKFRNQELIILIVTVVIFAGFSVFLDKFFSTGNLLTLMRSVSILGILSIAMAVVVISKGIDLSLIATLAVGTALASVLSSGDVLPSIDLPFIYAVLIGFIFTAILCALTGILVAYWDMASVFVTLAMAGVIYGLGRTLFIGDELNYLPEDAVWLEYMGRGQLFGVPMPIICFLSLAFLMHLVLTKTTFGKFVYSIGDSGLAARTAGVPRKTNTSYDFYYCRPSCILCGITNCWSNKFHQHTNGVRLYDLRCSFGCSGWRHWPFRRQGRHA